MPPGALELESIEAERTEMQIRVGVRGDLEISEKIHGPIWAELSGEAAS
jgi:hypothetical protein